MTQTGNGETLHPRVVVLSHNPVIERQGNRRLNQVLGWHEPDALVQQYINAVADASHGLVRYEVIERHEVDGYPVKVDGFQYSDDSFLRCWNARTGFHQPDGADYLRLMNAVAFMDKVQANLVDELWLMGFPYAGYYESAMGGRGAIWCNAPPLAGTAQVSRRFVVMGFNYERDAGCMLENLGHRAESILEHVFRRASPANNLWQQFTRYDRIAPGQASCGNVHFAPNSERDYDWGNRRSVLSTCDRWLSYPRLDSPPRKVNCAEWGNGDMLAHHVWWMQHFPHLPGTTPDGFLNNWWEYIVSLTF
jgi:hypothetical protein